MPEAGEEAGCHGHGGRGLLVRGGGRGARRRPSVDEAAGRGLDALAPKARMLRPGAEQRVLEGQSVGAAGAGHHGLHRAALRSG